MKQKEYPPEDCQGCGITMNNAVGGLCAACSADNYVDDKEYYKN